jgi:hypothetical protein
MMMPSDRTIRRQGILRRIEPDIPVCKNWREGDEQPISTFLQHALNSPNDVEEHAAPSHHQEKQKTSFVGVDLAPYPSGGTPADLTGIEPPLGVAIDKLPPMGTQREIKRAAELLANPVNPNADVPALSDAEIAEQTAWLVGYIEGPELDSQGKRTHKHTRWDTQAEAGAQRLKALRDEAAWRALSEQDLQRRKAKAHRVQMDCIEGPQVDEAQAIIDRVEAELRRRRV